MPSNPHSYTRPTSGMLNLKTLSAAVATALLFSNAHAAGLGKLTVLSSLGQPLRAEIELTSVSTGEAGALAVKLASVEAFQQANVNFNSALSSLRFSVEKRGERQYVRVTSSQPLNEPFVDMLLEMNGPNGRLVREYTFLLDPADLNATQAAQVVQTPAASASRPAQQPALPQQAAPAPESRPATAERAAPVRPQQQAQPQGGDDARSEEYRVRKGDTLARIAGQAKPAGVSLDQMLVALYRANPDAFIGQNMNRLKAGQILSLPGADAARSIGGAEARGIVVAQAADFNNYRSKLAAQVAAAAPPKSAEARQSAGGKITAKVEEQPTPANEAKDKLKLSNAAAAPGATTAEDNIARDKAAAEANARVKELEKNVGDLQQILEIKNKGLAEQQTQADAAQAAGKAADPAAADALGSAAAPTADAAPAAQTEASKEEAPAAAAKPKPVPAPAPAVPEPSFFDEVMGNPLVLPGLGALLVALGALGVIRARRQKQSKPFDDSILADSSLKTNSLFGATGGQNVDTSNSMFNSSFAPAATHLDSNEVDPVAEADVYIAYGRDAQAEEILKEALRTQPERHAVRVKLLEIYSNRKDMRAFEVLATELYGMTKGEGDEWSQAAAMGAVIDPNNPMYAGGKIDRKDVRDDFVAPTRPLEEQGLATLLSNTQPDTASMDTLAPLDIEISNPVESMLAGNDETESATEVTQDRQQPASNELDFDLDGIDLPDMTAPNTIPRPVAAESPAELASIDFDFLDEPSASASEAAPESTTEQQSVATDTAPTVQDLEFLLDDDIGMQGNDIVSGQDSGAQSADVASLDFDLDGLEEPAPAKQGESEAESLDFDLSAINLDLQPLPGESQSDFASPQAEHLAAEDLSSASAEMATKLDLALAYRDIGDKEGARELLDEVLKGGTPEQSEKAKSLLLELA